jgi:hypothetical protein
MSSRIEHLKREFQALQADPLVRAWRLAPRVATGVSLVEGIVDALAQLEKRQDELERARAALGGIASCASKCSCCAMHAEVAQRALNGG